MKKLLAISMAVLVLISLSGCQFNIFTAFDKIDIPGAADLLASAESDPEGFVDDVQEYVDSESITEDNADDIIDALVVVYTNEEGETRERAAILAGEIAIDSYPDTKFVVDNIVSAVIDAMDSGAEPDPEALIAGIFPSDMTQSEFSDILDNLSTAADAYKDFAESIDANGDGIADAGAADWMSSAEAGDMVQYAIVAIIITDINTVADPDELYNFITYGTEITTPYDDPFSSTEMEALLSFAGLDL